MDLATIKQAFPRSHVWDKETQDVVDGLRAFIYRQPQPTITEMQNMSLKARPVPDGFWSTRDEYPVPEKSRLAEVFYSGVQALGDFKVAAAPPAPVQVEWIGVKTSKAGGADSSQAASHTFSRLTEDASRELTIFHVHGGNLFQGSPASYRHVTTRLARLTGGRVVSVDYRRCPQNPLPAPLLDVFLAYLSLLFPPPNALHEPVHPSTIVLTGDSSGGLLLILLVLLIQNTKSLEPFMFHEHLIQLPLPIPAGIAIFSPVGESLQSVPSQERNRVHDIFIEPLWTLPTYPRCKVWPTYPPSPVIYCPHTDQLGHPLLVPFAWDDWHDFPPMWLGIGEDVFYDGAKAIARKAARQGVKVSWLEFEAMPHCFFMQPKLSKMKQADLIYEKWAQFCEEVIDTKSPLHTSPDAARACRVSFKDLREDEVSLEQPEDPDLSSIPEMIQRRVLHLTSSFERDWGERRGTKL